MHSPDRLRLGAVLLCACLLAGCVAIPGEEASDPSPAAAPASPSALPSPSQAPAPPPSERPASAHATPTPPAPTVGPVSSAPPSPSAPPEREAFSVNLYGEGDFVSEYTEYYCLPAAMQTMINIMRAGEPDTTRETQDRLYELAAELDGVDLPRRVRDVEPEGWANGLAAEGFGAWEVRAEPTRRDAIRLAARQLRLTGKPVGLLTWHGAHSWIMSGFEATADPLHFDDFEVTGVWIQDVWYPRISTIWGESDPPNTLVPFERLDEDYLKYRRPYGKFPDKDGQFVLVVPLEEAAAS